MFGALTNDRHAWKGSAGLEPTYGPAGRPVITWGWVGVGGEGWE